MAVRVSVYFRWGVGKGKHEEKVEGKWERRERKSDITLEKGGQQGKNKEGSQEGQKTEDR